MEKSNNLLKSILGILFTIIFSANVLSQSGWVQQNSGITGNLSYVQFPDENTGYVFNPSLKTTNGGTNWTQITPLPWATSYINWLDGNTSYYVDNVYPRGDLYKTTDGGNNWQSFNQFYYRQVSFINEATGYITCWAEEDYAFIKKTTNGGINWNSAWYYTVNYSYADLFYTGLRALNTETFYFSYSFAEVEHPVRWSRIYRTTNGGASVSYFHCDTLLLSISDCPSVDTAYATGRTWYAIPPDTIYYHIMKGVNNSWTKVFTTPNNLPIKGISFPNNNTGYVAVGNNQIFKTTDGASSWTVINTNTSYAINNVYFLNPQTGYAVGNNGLILKTTTGGETPITHSVSGTVRFQDNNQLVTSGYVKALSYNSQNQQISVVDSAAIGSNGTYMLPNCPPISLDIMAYENDEEDASFVPTYYVSTIFWENSTRVTPDSNLTGIDIGVYRINNNAGNMHIGGTVYRSDNEDLSVLKDAIVYARIGNLFKGYSVTGYPGTYSIDLLSSGTYEIIANRMGFYSAIRPFNLSTFSVDTIDFSLGILLVSVEPNENNIPEKYFLSQNYPNPFNPQTKIKFGLPVQTAVKLAIFDVIGREVGVLVNGELKAGEYDVMWNASSLSSGIYFYRIETDKFIETRKMVLIK